MNDLNSYKIYLNGNEVCTCVGFELACAGYFESCMHGFVYMFNREMPGIFLTNTPLDELQGKRDIFSDRGAFIKYLAYCQAELGTNPLGLLD